MQQNYSFDKKAEESSSVEVWPRITDSDEEDDEKVLPSSELYLKLSNN